MKAVAEKKRRQNIAEYIIYMYQMEDLLRAYQFNMEDISKYVVSHYPVSTQEKEETFSWFRNLAEAMLAEKLEKGGHLKETQCLVENLAKLHWELLKKDKTYFEIYRQAKPHLIHLMAEAKDDFPSNEVQLFLNTVYGRLLARLRGRDIPQDILEATEAFGNVLSYLNWAFLSATENPENT
ncbi:DUF4924 family protein [Cecembia calidifontis]|jgi:hypothetical protein|uniref:Uncharacterized protein DUF4924 n=1 Tax=Cecembia calidifontis TaxID=1187080 RepID=A0A4Q7PCW4_9BACT|nr:DUF4924 family protein [Cecembia calidifontis]RZS96632.1 uncharacterized protein DUF4924 [Cecembia calidifontis]